ncbi:MAG: (2Fe-2S)-binding protein [bacterium]|nr:(2Fe-2S)-binding protein [bacterium]
MRIALHVNGNPVEAEVPTTMRLLEFLRDRLHLTGVKEVCAEGECGACSIMFNGRVVNSCLVLAVEADGGEVVTVEGIDHPVQRTMRETHAVQCGYCFPGMVVTAADLINKTNNLDRATIRAELAGNVCRCTGYAKILDAVEKAASEKGN